MFEALREAALIDIDRCVCLLTGDWRQPELLIDMLSFGGYAFALVFRPNIGRPQGLDGEAMLADFPKKLC